MNRREDIWELINRLEELNIQDAEIQQECERVTEQLRIAQEEEEEVARGNRNRRPRRATICTGDRVIILNTVRLPIAIRGTRLVTEDDRRGIVTATHNGKVYLTTNTGIPTWRLQEYVAPEAKPPA